MQSYMPCPRITVRPRLSEEDLFQRYRNCPNAKQRSYWQTLWLLSRRNQPLTVQEVSQVVGFSSDWVRKIVRRYNALGPTGFESYRVTKRGQRSILTPDQHTQLSKLLELPPEEGKGWSGPKVAQWIKCTTGKKVSAVTGWKYLRKLGHIKE